MTGAQGAAVQVAPWNQTKIVIFMVIPIRDDALTAGSSGDGVPVNDVVVLMVWVME